jgi:hypothetical protein
MVGVLEFLNNWDWLFGAALGTFFLLIGYGILRAGDEAWYKKNGRFMRVCGFLCILCSISLVLLRLAAPRPHG